MNLSWLRQQMSLVSQEPVLFKTSVFENIRYGLIGRRSTPYSDEEIRKLVVQAAITANAHDFIEALPQGYDTHVGQMGAEVSGGQRQRIAIARAIIGDPKILLLDEATAALDTKSEQLVLEALHRASSGRTTIFITHRLSSIRHADQVVVMSQGRAVEIGTHDTLAKAGGFYEAALEKQNLLVSVKDDSADGPRASEAASSVTQAAHFRLKQESTAYEMSPIERRHATTRSEASSVGKQSLWSLIKLASSLNKPEWPLVLTGLVCCLLSGAVNPV